MEETTQSVDQRTKETTESDPPDLESQLAQLLQELSLVQEEMLEVLTSKCERIADSNLEGITELQQREESLGQRLQACHDQRSALLAMAADEGLPGDTLGSLASSLTAGHEGDLSVQVKEASARMRLLRHHSLANWVLTQRSMLHLSQLLEIILTGGRLKPTYGRDDYSISSGTLVDKDA
jgi:flagellar biosynthesis/type III secretory pathway chaperone